MNIVYVANEKYTKHLCISMLSLLDNNIGEDLNIYIVSLGISSVSQDILKSTALIYKRDLNIIEFSDIETKFTYKPDTTKFDISALGRLFLGDLLPENIEKVIYLDCDTIILKNLKRMYAIDLKGKLLAAALEPTIYADLKVDIGMYVDANYYNSGVLLIDLKQWRKTRATECVINYLENINEYCLFTDQDAINGAFMHRIKILSPKYNFISNYKYYSYNALVTISKRYSIIPKKDFDFAKKNPGIVHFAGDERPWKSWNFNPYKKAYIKYKNNSYYKDEPMENSNIFYMFAYHLINLSTYIYPKLRMFISKKFYEKLKREKYEKLVKR